MTVTPFMEGYENPQPGDYFTNGTGYTVDETSIVYQGSHARKFGTGASDPNNIARRNVTVNWLTTEPVLWFGSAIYLDPNFYSLNTFQCRLMGANDFNGSTQHVRIGIWINTDDRVYCFRHLENAGFEQFPLLSLGLRWIPAGVWTMVECFFQLSETPGAAITRVYKDGVLAGSNTTDYNIHASSALGNLTRMRYGFDAANGGSGGIANSYVIMDRSYADVVQQGPLTTGTDKTILPASAIGLRNVTSPLPRVTLPLSVRATSVSSTTAPTPKLVLTGQAQGLGQIQTPFREPPRPYANVKVGSSIN